MNKFKDILKEWWSDFKFDLRSLESDISSMWSEYFEELKKVWTTYFLDEYNIVGKILVIIVESIMNLIFTIFMFLVCLFCTVVLLMFMLLLSILGPPLGLILSFLWGVFMKIIKKSMKEGDGQ